MTRNESGYFIHEGDVEDYDCGLINDYGGGDVEWWQDYIRAEIGRANDWWRSRMRLVESSDGFDGHPQ